MNQKFKNNSNLEPIPIPLSQWIREFRVRAIPILVFIAAGIVVYFNWTTRVVTPDFIGAVYADKADLRAPATGTLADIHLEPFQRVQGGDVVGRVVVADPAVIEAKLAVITAQIEYLRSSREPEMDRERNFLNYQGMKLDLMQEKIALSTLKINKLRVGQSLDRNKILYGSNLISSEEFELVQFEYDIIAKEIEEKELLIREAEAKLGLTSQFFDSDEGSLSPTLTAINVQAQNLRLIESELMPVEIIAPLDGIVRLSNRKNGVTVTKGDLIARIEASEPQFIVGYVRQPFTVQPEEGMKVEVRSRRAGRVSFISEITNVGAHISKIDTLMMRPGVNFETGLPVKIAISNEVNLFPGEVVDLILRP